MKIDQKLMEGVKTCQYSLLCLNFRSLSEVLESLKIAASTHLST